MPLVQIPFAGGLDATTYPGLVDPSQYTSLSHAVSTQDKTLCKPFGTVRQPTLTSLIRIGASTTQLVGSDGLSLYELGTSWASRGRVAEFSVSRLQLLNGGASGTMNQQLDVTYDGRTVIAANNSNTATNFYVYQGRTLLASLSLSAGAVSSPTRVQVYASTYAIVVLGGNVWQVNLTTYAATFIETITTFSTTSPVDLVGMQSGNPVLIYQSAATVITLHRYTFGAAPAVATSATITISNLVHLAANYCNTAILLATVATGAASASLLHVNQTTLATTSTTSLCFATTSPVPSWPATTTVDVVSTTAGDAGVVYAFPHSATLDVFAVMQPFTGTTPGTAAWVPGGYNAYVQESRLFTTQSARAYMAIRAGQQAQLVDATSVLTLPGVPYGALRPAAAWSARLSDAHVSPVQAAPNGSGSVTTLPWRTLSASVGPGLTASVGVVTLTTNMGLSSCAPYGLGAVLSGSVPQGYDGTAATELGFMTEPQAMTVVPGTGGSYTGSVEFAACWAWVNARGEIERSAPSTPVVSSLTNVPSVTVTVASLPATSRTGGYLEIYRTTAGGTVFYLAASDAMIVTSNVIGMTTSGTNSDAWLQAQRIMYTQPGTVGTALARFAPPSLVSMFPFQDRVFGLAEDGQSIWYSGQFVSGELPWWQDQFTLTVPVRGSDVVALAGLNGNIYAFRRSGIVMFSGYGPPDNGQGGTFSDPTELPTEVGCINPSSVIATSLGIFFQSLRGIDLIDTGNNVSWIGRPVDALLRQYPTITSALVSEIDKRVIFTCTNKTTGISICYDLINGIWTSVQAQDATQTLAPIVSACLVSTVANGSQAVRATLTQSGYCYLETRSSYLQEGAYQSTTITPGPVKVSGIQGYQRVRSVFLTCNSVSPHDLLVSFATDDDPIYRESNLITWAQLSALPLGTKIEVTLADQKCSSLRVMIQDLPPSNGAALGTGAGPTYVSMALDVVAKDGPQRLQKGAR